MGISSLKLVLSLSMDNIISGISIVAAAKVLFEEMNRLSKCV
jgi:hypothetical protein